MTYYGAKEIAESFRTVRKNTIQVAEDIPEDKYSFKAADEVRTVEKLLTHIALAYKFQHQTHAIDRRSSMEGFNFPKLMQEMQADEAKPRTKAEVLDLLKTSGDEWATFLDGVSEEFLSEPVQGPGELPVSKSRLEMLISVKEHEMHHRGQLMMVERMIGIVPHLTRAMQERMAEIQAKAGKP